MGDVIWVSFGRKVQITRDEYFRAAARCEEAASQADDPEVRRILQDATIRYRDQGRQRF